MHLDNLKESEKVVIVCRRHWIVFVILGINIFGALVLSLFTLAMFSFNPMSLMLNICFWLGFGVFTYIQWINHELDMYVVTNNRIVGLDQISFLNRAISETNLGQVQEVNSQTKGFFANIFNYGTLTIQTAGASTTMNMGFCPDVIQSARKILNIVDEYRDSESQ